MFSCYTLCCGLSWSQQCTPTDIGPWDRVRRSLRCGLRCRAQRKGFGRFCFWCFWKVLLTYEQFATWMVYYMYIYIYSIGWWFGTFFIFPYIGNVIIPIDFHIFQRGWNHQPGFVDLVFLGSWWFLDFLVLSFMVFGRVFSELCCVRNWIWGILHVGNPTNHGMMIF